MAADGIGGGFGAGDFGARPAFVTERGADVGAPHFERGQRVAVLHPGAAHVAALGGLHLAAHAIDPVALAALVHLVGDPYGDGVEILVQRRHGPVHQDAAAEGFEGVVGEAGQWLGLQDARRGMPVTGDQHDLFGAHHGTGCVGDGVGARNATPRKLFHHLAQAVVGGKAVEEAAPAFHVAAHAGQGAFVLAEVAALQAGDAPLAGPFGKAAAGDDVAVQQVVFVLVQPDVEAAVALRVEAGLAAVAVDGVPALGVEVAEQAVVVGMFAVPGHGQQRVAAHLALQEEGALGGGAALAIVALAAPGADLVLEAVAGAGFVQTQGTVAAQGDHALHEAHGDHVAQLGHEIDVTHHLYGAGGHTQFHRLWGGRRQQQHGGMAIVQRHAHAGFQRVQVGREQALLVAAGAGQLQAAAGGFDVDEGFAAHGLVVGIEDTDGQFDRALAVGGHVVAVHLDGDAGNAMLQRGHGRLGQHTDGCVGHGDALQVDVAGVQRAGDGRFGPDGHGGEGTGAEHGGRPAQGAPAYARWCHGRLRRVIAGSVDLVVLLAAHSGPLCGNACRLNPVRAAKNRRVAGAGRISFAVTGKGWFAADGFSLCVFLGRQPMARGLCFGNKQTVFPGLSTGGNHGAMSGRALLARGGAVFG